MVRSGGLRPDGTGAAQGGSGRALVLEGSAASRGFHDPGGSGCEDSTPSWQRTQRR